MRRPPGPECNNEFRHHMILVSFYHAVTCPMFPAPIPSQARGAPREAPTMLQSLPLEGNSDDFVFDLQAPLLFESEH